ncbi:LysR family transcriptional regulator [Anaerosacchariphilus polymeriproducens]|uniref:LysR family transcriptional regulator n=1 Tax=Anaerosacchariphilus polymeriproducens TaxID=1812858 RepID=UPI001F24D2E8|nr:LysR family transcriptional regulator [Anaerosacchariphilus polymeriproducens]
MKSTVPIPDHRLKYCHREINLESYAFYKYGTLTKVAEEFHISQPTITRTMKRLEDVLGVTLFNRSANRIKFNEVGIHAAKMAEELLQSAEQYQSGVINFDRQLHTISAISCAPAPLWNLTPELSRKHPGQTISSKLIADLEQIERDFRLHKYDIAILPYPIDDEDFTNTSYIEEHLSINVPLDHALAEYSEVTSKQINGYNCLLSPEIGFWENFCKTKLPSSKFLVQKDDFSFQELIKESNLPCFSTNLAEEHFINLKNRINIPITDEDANVTFYLVQHNKK